ncbi:hypothetical protein BC830DRAFT_703701 [Chytriomyces sp. MP71]|nr:hypothetical protein BC830DRAFT_703701 [Chytriomyces sp. MP71]
MESRPPSAPQPISLEDLQDGLNGDLGVGGDVGNMAMLMHQRRFSMPSLPFSYFFGTESLALDAFASAFVFPSGPAAGAVGHLDAVPADSELPLFFSPFDPSTASVPSQPVLLPAEDAIEAADPASPHHANQDQPSGSPATRFNPGSYNEPGFDILMATPPTTPENLVAKRRGSCPTLEEKGSRLRTTENELQMLTAIFQKNPFPSAFLRKKLAERMGVTVKQIQFWFQNKRATLKAKNGIVVLKPTKGDNDSSFRAKTRRMSLTPLSNESPYFYVAADDDGNPLGPKPSLTVEEATMEQE